MCVFVLVISKMCQLLGLSSNKEVDIQLSLREFRHRGNQNPHGWGFAFIQNGNWKLIKKPDSLSSEDIKNEQFQFKSKFVVGHVRWASCGKRTHQNTHPFHIGQWIFAHNGTVSSIKNNSEFKLTKFLPEGQTDSEYAFCYLLEKIGNEENIERIKTILGEESDKIKKNGNFNFLLSNSKVLFVFGDNSLHFVHRKSPFQEVTLIDEDYSVNLQEIKAPDEKAIIIATKPFTKEEKWSQILGLKVFKDGEEE